MKYLRNAYIKLISTTLIVALLLQGGCYSIQTISKDELENVKDVNYNIYVTTKDTTKYCS